MNTSFHDIAHHADRKTKQVMVVLEVLFFAGALVRAAWGVAAVVARGTIPGLKQ